MLRKLLLVPVLLIIACVMAGVYGVVHNQVSCTVAPEYFTQFKYVQFGLSPETPLRVGAAIVGWGAAWWMGIVIGSVLVPVGMIVPGPRRFFVATVKGFGVAAGTALVCGLGALAVATLTIDAGDARQVVRYGNQMEDDVAFLRAGAMHNFSYAGGLLGIIAGSVFLVVERRRARRAKSAE